MSETSRPVIERLAVIGVGLIGGSFALALKAAGAVKHVVGMGRSRASLERARALGLVDEVASDPAALRGCDFVLLAAPVGAYESILRSIASQLEPHAVITDGGSTKQDVVAAARAAFAEHDWVLARFVPGHPIAGAERSGPEAARAALYQNRQVVLTPLPENSAETIARVEAMWKICGAAVHRMTPEEHDRVFAAVSHLPHALAFALVDSIASRPNASTLFQHAASGFRDFTRIASSDPEMWRDICLANRDVLLGELAAYKAALARIESHLQAADGAALEALFDRARTARNRWLRWLESSAAQGDLTR